MIKSFTSLDVIVFSLKIKNKFRDFVERFFRIPSFNLLLCLQLVKKFGAVGGGWWVVVVVVEVVLKATLVFIFGPNRQTRTLLRPRPNLNK